MSLRSETVSLSTHESSLGERRRILFLILIMTAVAIGAGGIVLAILYNVSFEQQRARLVETAQSQARILEAIARFDEEFSANYPGGHFAATLAQIRLAHERFEGFGDTGEFTLAKLEEGQIIFLLSHRHADLDDPAPVPFDSELAEPMRYALSGESGTVVGLDYRGERVLAAYEPVAELNLGIVAKIDLVEVKAPFQRAGFLAGGGGFILILLGTAVFLRVSNPLIQRLEESEKKYRSLFESSTDGIFLMTQVFEECNVQACQILIAQGKRS